MVVRAVAFASHAVVRRVLLNLYPPDVQIVRVQVTKGLLPAILDELLSARKQAKRDMAAATDPMEKAVQNGRQLALKVV